MWHPWWLEDDPFLLGFGKFSGANSLNFGRIRKMTINCVFSDEGSTGSANSSKIASVLTLGPCGTQILAPIGIARIPERPSWEHITPSADFPPQKKLHDWRTCRARHCAEARELFFRKLLLRPGGERKLFDIDRCNSFQVHGPWTKNTSIFSSRPVRPEKNTWEQYSACHKRSTTSSYQSSSQ